MPRDGTALHYASGMRSMIKLTMSDLVLKLARLNSWVVVCRSWGRILDHPETKLGDHAELRFRLEFLLRELERDGPAVKEIADTLECLPPGSAHVDIIKTIVQTHQSLRYALATILR